MEIPNHDPMKNYSKKVMRMNSLIYEWVRTKEKATRKWENNDIVTNQKKI